MSEDKDKCFVKKDGQADGLGKGSDSGIEEGEGAFARTSG